LAAGGKRERKRAQGEEVAWGHWGLQGDGDRAPVIRRIRIILPPA
jgi:hypothetical protein